MVKRRLKYIICYLYIFQNQNNIITDTPSISTHSAWTLSRHSKKHHLSIPFSISVTISSALFGVLGAVWHSKTMHIQSVATMHSLSLNTWKLCALTRLPENCLLLNFLVWKKSRLPSHQRCTAMRVYSCTHILPNCVSSSCSILFPTANHFLFLVPTRMAWLRWCSTCESSSWNTRATPPSTFLWCTRCQLRGW